MLPDIHGLDVLKQLRNQKEYQSLPIIIQSGAASIDSFPRDLAISGFIPKPYNKTTVLSSIQEAFEVK